MSANMDNQEHFRNRAQVICDLCNEEVQDHIYNPCGHVFCWACISAYRKKPPSPGNNCPTCYFNQPLQLVSTDSSGQLQLEESAVQRCFLECDDCPVHVISVVGERRTGKSFLMNYLMRALRNLEKKKAPYLGGENEILNGFPWRPGTDKVTEGIWIWGKPFILENNGKKIAVFLLDTEGTKNTTCHETSIVKLFVLTMMISSHLVYNVNADVKETDINYLEIYCEPIENNPFQLFFGLKYFDVLVRDRKDGEDCEADVAKSYIEEQIKKLGTKDMTSVLNMVEASAVQCFLMPHPGNTIAEGERARLRDMQEDFQRSLSTYLMDVARRTQMCSSVMTSRKMAAKLQMCVEYIQNEHNFSSPLELCKGLMTQVEKKTEREMESMKNEFQDFLKGQTWWTSPSQMSTLISEKVTEVIKGFQERSLLTRDEHRQSLVEKLLVQMQEDGDNFCATHTKDLKYAGLKAAIHVGLTAVTAAIPFMFPVVAPVAAPGLFSTVVGWFWATPAVTAMPQFAIRAAMGGMGMLQVGVAYMMKK